MPERVSTFSAQHAVDDGRRGLLGYTVSFFDAKSLPWEDVCKVAETCSVAGLLVPPILALTNAQPLPLSLRRYLQSVVRLAQPSLKNEPHGWSMPPSPASQKARAVHLHIGEPYS